MNWWNVTGAIAAGALFVACQGGGGKAPAGTRYVVVADRAPFYEQGPAQGYGPDFNLSKGQIVTMVQPGGGFSQVKSDTDRIGYVANEQIEVAPREAQLEPPSLSTRSSRRDFNDDSTGGSAVVDVPLPEEEPKPVTSFRY